MYYAVLKDGVCIAKIIADSLDGYVYPFPHDALVEDPDNSMVVVETSAVEQGTISGKLDTSIKHQATSLRLIIALNILGMTGGTITVGTQALDGWPVIEKLLGLL